MTSEWLPCVLSCMLHVRSKVMVPYCCCDEVIVVSITRCGTLHMIKHHGSLQCQTDLQRLLQYDAHGKTYTSLSGRWSSHYKLCQWPIWFCQGSTADAAQGLGLHLPMPTLHSWHAAAQEHTCNDQESSRPAEHWWLQTWKYISTIQVSQVHLPPETTTWPHGIMIFYYSVDMPSCTCHLFFL